MKPIGIIGLGDLGSQLARQIIHAGFRVVAFDVDQGKEVEGVINFKSANEVLESCSLVHWAIPSKQLNQLPDIFGSTIVVLHDSVMAHSKHAIKPRSDGERFAIAHFLKNEMKRVLIARDAIHTDEILEHFKTIGFNPKITTVKDHDTLAARSQGVMAALLELGLRTELDEASKSGDLTKSGEELHRVLVERELNLTQNTLDSVLSNPELKQVGADMIAVLNKR